MLPGIVMEPVNIILEQQITTANIIAENNIEIDM